MQQVQTVIHKIYQSIGGDAMKYVNVVTINNEEVELESLPDEERQKMVKQLNTNSVEHLGYQRDKTA